MMKKLIALFLTLCLLCSLAGCSARYVVSLPDDDDSPSSTSRPEPPRASSVPEPEEEEPEGDPEKKSEEEPGDTSAPDDMQRFEAILGTWNGRVYSNEVLGISYTLPAGWEYSSAEKLWLGLDSPTASDHERLLEKLSEEDSGLLLVMLTSPSIGGNSIQLGFEDLKGRNDEDVITEEIYAEGIVNDPTISIVDGSVNFGKTYRAQLGGKDFLVQPADMTMDEIEIQMWLYIRREGDWMAMIVFGAFSGADVETMEGGVSAFAPLSGASGGAPEGTGSTGTSGAPGVLTATGDIGRTFSTMFFDYTVVSAYSPAVYDGYKAAAGNKLLVVRVRVKNDFGSTLPMYDTDFPLFWGNGDYEYSWAVDAFNDDMMPLEWELADGQEATWDMLFEVPADRVDFSLSYLEEYTDRYGSDQTGEWYDAQFSLLISSAA